MIDILRKIWSIASSPWALLALAVAGALLLAWRLNAGRGELAELRAEKERARLVAEGFLAAKHDVEEQAKALLSANADLAAEVERLKKSAPGARIVYVTRAATKPSPAGGEPRPGNAPPSGGGGQPPNLAVGQGPGAKPESPPGACPPCLLAAGDLGTVMVQEVGLETRAGNRIVVGEAWAWRTRPGRARLFGGPWAAELSELAAEPPAAASGGPGWGGGGWAAAGSGGAVAGPAVAFPPLWGLELTAGGGLGARGAWGAGGTLVWRAGR